MKLTENSVEQALVENWVDVPGYEGFYQVSDQGRVRRYQLLAQTVLPNGYIYVGLSVPVPKRISVHTLVLKSFNGPRPTGNHCRHLNGNKTDNRLENLAWGTPKENRADAVRHGTQGCGELAPMCRITTVQALEIKSSNLPTKELALIYGFSRGHINDIRSGKRWKHLKAQPSTWKPRPRHRITLNGETHSLEWWCRKFGIPPTTVRARMLNGKDGAATILELKDKYAQRKVG